jgi:NADP-dependent 3-hydroxy acid dehydrogenase YdfG
MAETEFSLVRFDGDAARAKKVYEGLKPLEAEDVADAIGWVVTRPPHVNVDEIVIKPLAQATAMVTSRKRRSARKLGAGAERMKKPSA